MTEPETKSTRGLHCASSTLCFRASYASASNIALAYSRLRNHPFILSRRLCSEQSQLGSSQAAHKRKRYMPLRSPLQAFAAHGTVRISTTQAQCSRETRPAAGSSRLIRKLLPVHNEVYLADSRRRRHVEEARRLYGVPGEFPAALCSVQFGQRLVCLCTCERCDGLRRQQGRRLAHQYVSLTKTASCANRTPAVVKWGDSGCDANTFQRGPVHRPMGVRA